MLGMTQLVLPMMAMRLSHLKLVAGLDLARRRDHSALVLLDVEPDRLTVRLRCACRRLRCASSSP